MSFRFQRLLLLMSFTLQRLLLLMSCTLQRLLSNFGKILLFFYHIRAVRFQGISNALLRAPLRAVEGVRARGPLELKPHKPHGKSAPAIMQLFPVESRIQDIFTVWAVEKVHSNYLDPDYKSIQISWKVGKIKSKRRHMREDLNVQVFILLGCGTTSLCDRCPTVGYSILTSSSAVETINGHFRSSKYTT